MQCLIGDAAGAANFKVLAGGGARSSGREQRIEFAGGIER